MNECSLTLDEINNMLDDFEDKSETNTIMSIIFTDRVDFVDRYTLKTVATLMRNTGEVIEDK